MEPLPTIISFYTKDSPYEWEAEGLINSCKNFSLECEIEGVPSAGSWELNCAYKPLFILRMLQKLKKGVLWVDCDAVFECHPESIPAFKADIAVRSHPECHTDHIAKINSGTFFANYTPAGVEIVKTWAEHSLKELSSPDRKEEFWDQTTLRDVIKKFNKPAEIGLLPLEYLKIFDHPLHVVECANPVIVHHQASRLYKSWMNVKH